MYQHQHAAIAALESHLRAYGYTAQCPCRAPAEPLAELHATQQQLVHAAETLPADMQKGCNSGMEGGGSTTEAAGSAADAVDHTCASVDPAAKAEPPANACSTDAAGAQLQSYHACIMLKHKISEYLTQTAAVCLQLVPSRSSGCCLQTFGQLRNSKQGRWQT